MLPALLLVLCTCRPMLLAGLAVTGPGLQAGEPAGGKLSIVQQSNSCDGIHASEDGRWWTQLRGYKLPAPHTAGPPPPHLQVPKLPFSCSTLMNTLASLSRVEVPNLTCSRAGECAFVWRQRAFCP